MNKYITLTLLGFSLGSLASTGSTKEPTENFEQIESKIVKLEHKPQPLNHQNDAKDVRIYFVADYLKPIKEAFAC